MALLLHRLQCRDLLRRPQRGAGIGDAECGSHGANRLRPVAGEDHEIEPHGPQAATTATASGRSAWSMLATKPRGPIRNPMREAVAGASAGASRPQKVRLPSALPRRPQNVATPAPVVSRTSSKGWPAASRASTAASGWRLGEGKPRGAGEKGRVRSFRDAQDRIGQGQGARLVEHHGVHLPAARSCRRNGGGHRAEQRARWPTPARREPQGRARRGR